MTAKRALQIFAGLMIVAVIAFIYRWKTLPVLEEDIPPEDVPMGSPINTEEWHPVIPGEGENTASKEAEELQQKIEEAAKAQLEQGEDAATSVNTHTAETATTDPTIKVPIQKVPDASKQQRNNEAVKKGEIKKYKTKQEAAKAPASEKKQQEKKQEEVRKENQGYDPWAGVDPSIIGSDGDGKVNATPAIPIDERMNSESF